MKHRNQKKYNRSMSHRRAILYMIGQSVDVFNECVSVADVAAWMNVTKQTANRHLAAMVDDGLLIMNKVPYKNTEKNFYQLTHVQQRIYEFGWFKVDYQAYAQKVMKVILTDDD